ncbi:MAG: 3'-5' exonuclease, partial [FCB group bacterium]
NKVRRKIKYLMIDEFQDTNQIQYDIMRKIVPELEVDSDLVIDNANSIYQPNNQINFFVVGDAKQSIYGFRSADVRIFAQAITDIQNANTDILLKSTKKTEQPVSDEEKGYIELSASFRHEPVVAAFINDVCSEISKDKLSEWDVEYSDLVCTQGVEKLESEIKKNKRIENYELGSVNFIFDEIDTTNKQVDEKSEEELLSEFINDIVLHNKFGEKINYGDISVLSRTRTGFSNLINIFQKYNIPYIQNSGKGFYQTQEIIDIISFLKFLNNPNDDVAFAGILKSPFFDITNTELFLITKYKNGENTFDRLDLLCEKLIDDNKLSEKYSGIIRARNILKELIALAPRLPVSMLILKIIEITNMYGIISGTVSQSQIESNINKVLQIARDFEEKGFRNLVDFVNDIDSIIQSEANESEAVILKGENAVNIMTIHASKGLQFPVVILYNTNTRSTFKDNFFIDEKLGLTFPITSIDVNYGVSFRIDTPMLFLAKQKKKNKELSEEKRILYVALTRAQKHLIISGKIKKNKDKFATNGLLDLILKGLNSSIATMENQENIFCESNLDILGNDNKIRRVNFIYSINVFKNLYKTLPEYDYTLEEKLYSVPFHILEPVKSRIENELYSASKLLTFEKDNEEYIKRYLFGLHSEDDRDYTARTDSVNKDDDNILGTLAGTLIHSILEKMPLWFDSKSNINDDYLNKLITSVIEDNSRSVSINLKNRIRQELINIASTELLKKYSKYFDESHSEYYLQIPFGTGFLVSQIDLLLKDENGEYEIWDWKTNRVDSKAQIEKLVKEYEIQMQVYSYFISLLNPDQKQFKARLLFTRLARQNTSDEAWTRIYTWNKNDVEMFKKNIEQKIKAILNVINYQ